MMSDISWFECQDIKTSMDFYRDSCSITNLAEGTPSRSHFTLYIDNVSFQANRSLWTTMINMLPVHLYRQVH